MVCSLTALFAPSFSGQDLKETSFQDIQHEPIRWIDRPSFWALDCEISTPKFNIDWGKLRELFIKFSHLQNEDNTYTRMFAKCFLPVF